MRDHQLDGPITLDRYWDAQALDLKPGWESVLTITRAGTHWVMIGHLDGGPRIQVAAYYSTDALRQVRDAARDYFTEGFDPWGGI